MPTPEDYQKECQRLEELLFAERAKRKELLQIVLDYFIKNTNDQRTTIDILKKFQDD